MEDTLAKKEAVDVGHYLAQKGSTRKEAERLTWNKTAKAVLVRSGPAGRGPGRRMLTVVIDTREQKPFSFKGLPSVTRKLDFGDYSAVGLLKKVAIERKSLSDLWGTVSTAANFARFERELAGASKAGVRLWVVVEASPEQVAWGNKYSSMNGYRLLDNLHQVAEMYGHGVSFGGTREGARIVTLAILRGAGACAGLRL